MISAVIIARDAELLIGDCIKSLHFCDEIVVADSGSTDKTIEIAKSLGATIVKTGQGDFAKQRNEGMHHAKGEWILYVDTDERVSPQLADSIQKAIQNQDVSAFKIQRKNFYLGNNEWPKIELLERFFKKKCLKGWRGKLHETAIVDGEVGVLEGYLLHYTHKTLDEMLAKTIVWSRVEAQLRIDVKHPPVVWWRFIRVMATGFWDSYIIQGGWRIGTAGLVESIYQAYSMFITYVQLWEMQQHYENIR